MIWKHTLASGATAHSVGNYSIQDRCTINKPISARNWNARNVCVCVCLVKAKMKCLQERFKESKRFCKCNCFTHKEACPLSPCLYNEKRWPGSDVCTRSRKQYISADDRAFLDGLNPKPDWWMKAWGKRWAVRYRSPWQCKDVVITETKMLIFTVRVIHVSQYIETYHKSKMPVTERYSYHF